METQWLCRWLLTSPLNPVLGSFWGHRAVCATARQSLYSSPTVHIRVRWSDELSRPTFNLSSCSWKHFSTLWCDSRKCHLTLLTSCHTQTKPSMSHVLNWHPCVSPLRSLLLSLRSKLICYLHRSLEHLKLHTRELYFVIHIIVLLL